MVEVMKSFVGHGQALASASLAYRYHLLHLCCLSEPCWARTLAKAGDALKCAPDRGEQRSVGAELRILQPPCPPELLVSGRLHKPVRKAHRLSEPSSTWQTMGPGCWAATQRLPSTCSVWGCAIIGYEAKPVGNSGEGRKPLLNQRSAIPELHLD